MQLICHRCVQLVPQIIKNYRRRGTDGLSAVMMFSWAIAAVPFGIYNIAQYLNIPLQLQPQLFLILCLITWAQCMYYDHNWSRRKCILVVTVICLVFGGIEVGAIFGIRVYLSRFMIFTFRSQLITVWIGQPKYSEP